MVNMKLEPHRCDLCYELLYHPENFIHTIELDRGTNNLMDYELCAKCYDALCDWIVKRIEKT